jgi:arylformamidase
VNPTWRNLDPEARDREYSPSSCIGGDYKPFVQAYVDRSLAARAATPGRLNLQYGRGDTRRLDLFVPPAAAGSADPPPLLVFIHGGYWQELSKNDSSFAATDCVAQGIAYAALGYTLAPRASVAQIVAECRSAVNWLHANAQSLGIDAQRIVVAGSSAGAHLAAMTALPSVGVAQVKAAVLVSGIYELEPLIGTSINPALGLTPEAAREISPALRNLQGFPPSIVCWGEVETGEFKRQSRDFAAQLDAVDTPCQVFEVPRRNHFDIILDLADPQTQLGRAVTELIRSLY